MAARAAFRRARRSGPSGRAWRVGGDLHRRRLGRRRVALVDVAADCRRGRPGAGKPTATTTRAVSSGGGVGRSLCSSVSVGHTAGDPSQSTASAGNPRTGIPQLNDRCTPASALWPWSRSVQGEGTGVLPGGRRRGRVTDPLTPRHVSTLNWWRPARPVEPRSGRSHGTPHWRDPTRKAVPRRGSSHACTLRPAADDDGDGVRSNADPGRQGPGPEPQPPRPEQYAAACSRRLCRARSGGAAGRLSSHQGRRWPALPASAPPSWRRPALPGAARRPTPQVVDRARHRPAPPLTMPTRQPDERPVGSQICLEQPGAPSVTEGSDREAPRTRRRASASVEAKPVPSSASRRQLERRARHHLGQAGLARLASRRCGDPSGDRTATGSALASGSDPMGAA